MRFSFGMHLPATVASLKCNCNSSITHLFLALSLPTHYHCTITIEIKRQLCAFKRNESRNFFIDRKAEGLCVGHVMRFNFLPQHIFKMIPNF